jgi:hypothetical protein|tara:strand:- start:488 stop:676 length:189 start_codon:yes stop_codon:yes gene_type:complete
MLKFIRNWIKETDAISKEMNKLGIYTVITPFGGYHTHCVNTRDDKQNTIQQDDRKSKEYRQV